MFKDYGYMEEGKLGKPYNLRLLRRLLSYGGPYRRAMIMALSLSLLITLCELAVPYLSKVAIDDYIVSSWIEVDLRHKNETMVRLIKERYGHLLKPGPMGLFHIISNKDIRKIDPKHLRLFREGGIMGEKRFYLIRKENLSPPLPMDLSSKVISLPSGDILLPYEEMAKLSPRERALLRAEDIKGVTLVGLFLMGLVCFSFGLGYGEHYLLEYVGQNIMNDIRLELFSKMQGQAISFFDRQPIGRLVTRVTNDVENLNEMFKSVIITVFKDFFILSGIVIVLVVLNWTLAIICFSLIPVIFSLTFVFSKMAREAFRELREKVAKINAFLQERLGAIHVIQLFCAEKSQLRQFKEINHENYLAGMKQIRVFAVFMPVMELLASVGVAILIWYGGGKVIQDRITLGSLVAFIGYIQMFFKPIRDISEKYNIMQSAMASTERIFEFMDHDERIPESQNPKTPSSTQGQIEFQGVSFSYDEGTEVLREISMDLRPGQTVAIVGPTGSGKTTLINLVERFYDPEKGGIFFDRVDLKDWPIQRLRKNIGLVMQDVFIFAGSISENISLGRPEVGEQEIMNAVRMANLTPVIDRLPGGLNHIISQGGSSLSVGERQLLSFARALAGHPPLLVLDEATSSVDPHTEGLIQDAVSKISGNRTTLAVAHRLSTIRQAHKILVIHKGRIVEQGTHSELLKKQGIYYRLARLRRW